MGGKSPAEVTEISDRAHKFWGVIIPTGPSGQYKSVKMYVALAESTSSKIDGKIVEKIVTTDCATVQELHQQIDKLKKDLDWLHEKMEQKLQQARGAND